jgi:hypothetical protein
VGLHGPAKAEWVDGWWARKNEKWSRGRTRLPKKTCQNQDGCIINLRILNRILDSDIKDSSTFELNSNWGQIGIN